MKRMIGMLLALLWIGAAGAQEVAFEDVQILERDRERIKSMGDLRGDPKLLNVRVRFREADFLISGNDYRYGFLTVVPYAAIQTLMYSDIGDVPKEMRADIPLFHENYAGGAQRWFRIAYAGDDEEVLLMLGRDTARELVDAVEDHSGKPVSRFVDGLKVARSDAVFRGCRIFQTIEARKGRIKTDDFACVVYMTDAGFVVRGADKDYQGRLDISYANVRELAYEHGKASSYMGRMPGLGAFKKEKHWFVVDYASVSGEPTGLLMLLDENEAADFRDAAAQRTGLPIKTYAVAAHAPTVVAPAPLSMLDPSAAQPSLPALRDAKTLRCTLGPGYRAAWTGRAMARKDARFDDAAPDLVFEQIDLDGRTAQLRHGDRTFDAHVIAGDAGLTFLVLDRNQTLITSVLVQDGRLICVHSQHTGGEAPAAGQFYGMAEVVE